MLVYVPYTCSPILYEEYKKKKTNIVFNARYSQWDIHTMLYSSICDSTRESYSNKAAFTLLSGNIVNERNRDIYLYNIY